MRAARAARRVAKPVVFPDRYHAGANTNTNTNHANPDDTDDTDDTDTVGIADIDTGHHQPGADIDD
jgi:hypothetical protein